MISATPSPFARMNRIALHEKGIPFELQNEVPWDSTTATRNYNPLEKLPILLFPDSENQEPVYDSAHIQNFIVTKYADKSPKLVTGDINLDLKARQLLTLSEGVLDAFVLIFWESKRPENKQSAEWLARQQRKIDGGLAAFESLCQSRQPKSSEYIINDTYTIADIAIACATAQIDFGSMRPGWREKYPELAKWYTKMEERDTFKKTYPVMFEVKDSVV
ncbi:hypothetical protein LTR51_004709 [Lithohypha guttulata]|nr:hypothetical protein LTR51_004709 [Lithohypha guttulata]